MNEISILIKTIQLCVVGFCHGYNSKSHVKEYDKDCLQNEVLLTSSQTGFQISYLYSCVLQVLFSKATMESLTNIYNEMYETGDDGIEDTKKDGQLHKEKSEEVESFIGEEKKKRVTMKKMRVTL